MNEANIIPDDSCPFCRAGADELTLTDVVRSDLKGQAVTCSKCGATGPPRESAYAAQAAWRLRYPPVIKLDANQFVVAHGYDKFLLTYAQMITWIELRQDPSVVNRLGQQRKLLQEWQLLPPLQGIYEEKARV